MTQQKLRYIATYREPTDPSSSEVDQLKQAINTTPQAAILAEIPGSFHIEVDNAHASALIQVVKGLDAWEISPEVVANMPQFRGL